MGNRFAVTEMFELLTQDLSSQLSQVYEEKNALSLQLRGSGRSICESHQQYNEVLSRCLVLEKQLQELQAADKSMVRVSVKMKGRARLTALLNEQLCGCLLSSSFSVFCHVFVPSLRGHLQLMLLLEHPKKRMNLEAVTHRSYRSCS